MRTLIFLSIITGFLVFHLSEVAVAGQVSIKIKANLKKGHVQSCIISIMKQMNQYGKKNLYSEAKITSYCYCLGSAYFDNFTTKDFKYLKRTTSLPPRINNRRGQIQNSCARQTLE